MVEQDVVEDEARKRMKEEVEWNVEEDWKARRQDEQQVEQQVWMEEARLSD